MAVSSNSRNKFWCMSWWPSTHSFCLLNDFSTVRIFSSVNRIHLWEFFANRRRIVSDFSLRLCFKASVNRCPVHLYVQSPKSSLMIREVDIDEIFIFQDNIFCFCRVFRRIRFLTVLMASEVLTTCGRPDLERSITAPVSSNDNTARYTKLRVISSGCKDIALFHATFLWVNYNNDFQQRSITLL